MYSCTTNSINSIPAGYSKCIGGGGGGGTGSVAGTPTSYQFSPSCSSCTYLVGFLVRADGAGSSVAALQGISLTDAGSSTNLLDGFFNYACTSHCNPATFNAQTQTSDCSGGITDNGNYIDQSQGYAVGWYDYTYGGYDFIFMATNAPVLWGHTYTVSFTYNLRTSASVDYAIVAAYTSAYSNTVGAPWGGGFTAFNSRLVTTNSFSGYTGKCGW